MTSVVDEPRLEGQAVAPGGRLPDRDQLASGHDRGAHPEMVGDRLGELLVPAPDVEALVRLAEDGQPGRLGLEREQVDQVERRLLGGVRAVLDRVGRVEQHPERRGVSARHPRLDPVVHAHGVEGRARVGEIVERRRERRRRLVGDDRFEHRREILVGLRLGVVVAEEPVGVLGPGRLGVEQVVEAQVEALGQLPDRPVAGVDQLAPPLGDLTAARSSSCS